MEQGKKADETPELPWDKTPFSGWRETVDNWSWLQIGDGDWEKSGLCQRCRHGMKVEKQGSYSVTVAVSEKNEVELMIEAEEGPFRVAIRDEELFFARCDCGEDHPGRPEQITRGCGQWGLIDPPPGDE